MNFDISSLWNSVLATVGDTLPNILVALAILVIGWLVALILRAVVRKALGMLKVNPRFESLMGQKLDLQNGISAGVFYLLMVFVLVAFFDQLKLQLVSEPLQSLLSQVTVYLPKLVGGLVLALVAWMLATLVEKISSKALSATNLDDQISTEAGMKPISQSLSKVLYWVTILLFLPAILGTLGISGLLEPVQGMTTQLLQMVPNIFAALVIGLVGWFLARILRDLVSNLLSATGVDRLGDNVGFSASMKLSALTGFIVYVFVLVPALIAALDALKIEAISGPATEMLSTLMAAIPNIFAAAIILTVAYVVSRFVASIVTNLLGGVAFDELPQKVGVAQILPATTKPSQLVGKGIVFFAMLFAVVEASNKLGFSSMSEIVAMLIEFGGQVLLGLVIIGVGFWLSNIAHGAMSRLQGANASFFAGLARFAILGIVFAMGLRAMGLADEIVTLAFGLTLGAIAVAVALSFGLGGREAAGRQMEHWLSRMRS